MAGDDNAVGGMLGLHAEGVLALAEQHLGGLFRRPGHGAGLAQAARQLHEVIVGRRGAGLIQRREERRLGA